MQLLKTKRQITANSNFSVCFMTSIYNLVPKTQKGCLKVSIKKPPLPKKCGKSGLHQLTKQLKYEQFTAQVKLPDQLREQHHWLPEHLLL